MDKIKVYLDTNMILDVFINHARAMKNKKDILLPKKYEFMLENREKIKFITSFITKAEVEQNLSGGFGLTKDEIEKLWYPFVDSLNCKFIDSFTFDTKISNVASSGIKIRTLFNFMHLFIAIEEKCFFVTGDKDMITKIKRLSIYENVIDYIQLRNIVEGEN